MYKSITNIMQMGYNTLDLAMLLIVAFVIFVATRVPVKDAPAKKLGLRSDIKQEDHPNSYSLK
ncbi:MAG: hypothetical protein JWR76_2389 [Mucilaginibacter sp.]|nr:hypothetical protein [Mucilaginibacter sp.]